MFNYAIYKDKNKQKEVRSRLQRAYANSGMTIQELSEEIGVCWNSLYFFIHGRSFMQLATIIRVVDWLENEGGSYIEI